jgi:hypothetical protein
MLARGLEIDPPGTLKLLLLGGLFLGCFFLGFRHDILH